MQISTATMVVAAIALIAAAVMLRKRRGRERFASQRAHEVYRGTRDMFDKSQGSTTYSEFKTRIPGADPVLYTDTRKLWKSGRLTPDDVEKVL